MKVSDPSSSRRSTRERKGRRRVWIRVRGRRVVRGLLRGIGRLGRVEEKEDGEERREGEEVERGGRKREEAGAERTFLDRRVA